MQAPYKITGTIIVMKTRKQKTEEIVITAIQLIGMGLLITLIASAIF